MESKKIYAIIIVLSLFLSLCLGNAGSRALGPEYILTYDNNGNLIKGVDNYYEYDGLNQLIRIREGDSSGRVVSEFVYDHEGNRIKKIDYSGGKATTTYYVGNSFVQTVNDSGTYNTVYYYDSVNLVGRKDHDGGKYFYHSNHLGSANLVTDGSGNGIEEIFYKPFGELTETSGERFLFTGKELDKSDLYYYGARYYDPLLSKFTQPDTIIQDVYDPQNLNRYAYARNNPFKYTDPSGHFWHIALGTAIGAVIGAGASMISQIWHGASLFDGSMDWRAVGKSALIGAAGGAVGAAAGGFVAPLFKGATGLSAIAGGSSVGAVAGSTGMVGAQVTSNIISGEAITNNVFESAVLGAKVGGITGALTGVVSPKTSIRNAGQKLKSWSYKVGPVETAGETTLYRYYGSGSEMKRGWLTTLKTTSKETSSRSLAKVVKSPGKDPYTQRIGVMVPKGTRMEGIGYGMRGAPQVKVIKDDLSKLVFLEDTIKNLR